MEGLLYKTWQTAQEIRAGMKTMGQAADVPIEPNEQTSLIDACLEVPGVVCGGVPGGASDKLAIPATKTVHTDPRFLFRS